mmetsp:Transcript_103020/g.330432  ORF Transcript_103020/g.330432 Transcript_103020/m.330432 type:complete len:260 (-) Transcript_103020:653-1432(-)
MRDGLQVLRVIVGVRRLGLLQVDHLLLALLPVLPPQLPLLRPSEALANVRQGVLAVAALAVEAHHAPASRRARVVPKALLVVALAVRREDELVEAREGLLQLLGHRGRPEGRDSVRRAEAEDLDAFKVQAVEIVVAQLLHASLVELDGPGELEVHALDLLHHVLREEGDVLLIDRELGSAELVARDLLVLAGQLLELSAYLVDALPYAGLFLLGLRLRVVLLGLQLRVLYGVVRVILDVASEAAEARILARRQLPILGV